MNNLRNILVSFILISIFTQELTGLLGVQIGNISLYLSILIIPILLLTAKIDKILRLFILYTFILITISFISLLINQEKNLIDIFQLIKLNSIFFVFLLGYYLISFKNLLSILLKTYVLFLIILLIQNIEILSGLKSYVRILYMNFLFFEIETGNLFAVLLVIIVFTLNYFFMLKNPIISNSKLKIILLVIANILTVLMLVSINSRTSFIIYAFSFILIYGRILILSTKRRIALNLIFVVIGAFLIIVFAKITPVWDRLMYTISKSGSLDNSSLARLYVSKAAIEQLLSSPLNFLFGFGFREFYYDYFSYRLNSPHNGFINIAYKVGIVYLSIFLLLIKTLVFKIKSKFPFVFLLILTIMIFLSALTADSFNYLPLMQFYFFVIGTLYKYEMELNNLETITTKLKNR